MVARPRDYDSGGRLVVDGSWWQAWRCGRMSRFLRNLWEDLGAAPGAVDMWASDGAPQQACGILGIRGEIGWGEDDPFGFGSKVVEAADMVHVGNREESASTSQEKSASTSPGLLHRLRLVVARPRLRHRLLHRRPLACLSVPGSVTYVSLRALAMTTQDT